MRRTFGFYSVDWVLFIFLLVIISVAMPVNINAKEAWRNIEHSCYLDIDESTLDCLMNNQCDNFDGNVEQLRVNLNQFMKLDLKCQVTPKLKKKAHFLSSLLAEVEWFWDHPEMGFEPSPTELCGNILDDAFISIEMEPEEVNLEVEEEITITAKIIHNYCTGSSSPLCGCEEDLDCDGGVCKEEILKGDLEWSSFDKDIVEVKSVSSDGYQATVVGKKQGSTFILANATDITDIGISPLLGITDVEVGSTPVDIAFVISTHRLDNVFMYPDDFCYGWLSEHAPSFYQKMNELFTDFQVGVFAYSEHPSLCTDPENWCGYPLGPCYASASHGVGITDSNELVDAFSQLEIVCAADSGYPQHRGTSMYSGLMRAINEYPWSDDAKKAIILVGGMPAGVWYSLPEGEVNTYVEPVSYISRLEVIEAARTEEIPIHVIHTSAYFECSGDPTQREAIMLEENTTLATATGGIYYPSNFCFVGLCYPAASESILQALEDIHDSNDSNDTP